MPGRRRPVQEGFPHARRRCLGGSSAAPLTFTVIDGFELSGKFNEREKPDDCSTFIMGGWETTSCAVQWALNAAQEELAKEINRV